MKTQELIRKKRKQTGTGNIYDQKYRWKILLVVLALIIVSITLFYNNRLANQLRIQERKRVENLAKAYGELNKLQTSNTSAQLSYLTSIITSNTTIPVILVNGKGVITETLNINEDRNPRNNADSAYFYNKLQQFTNKYPPIEIVYDYVDNLDNNKKKTFKQYVYYNDSFLLSQLRFYPYVQLGIIGIFLLVSYIVFDIARRSEQNKVWLGMAKETAHQLGTPLFSMVGWIEILKEMDDDDGTAAMVGTELEKDVNRLQLIADRFSKIGSEPTLIENNIVISVDRVVHYVKRRASSKIKFAYTRPDSIITKTNPILFDWVVENLLKNALDAMGGTGNIVVKVTENTNDIYIDVSDTGKGIPKSRFKTIFEPGFSTKKRGWGLGLSLSKRIIENYHKGKIFVLDSIINEGTTFRVILPK